MTPKTRHKFQPRTHPFEAEDRGSGPYDVIVLVLIIIALIIFLKYITGQP